MNKETVFDKGKRTLNVLNALMIRYGYDPICDNWIIEVGKCTRESCGAINIIIADLDYKSCHEQLKCSGCGYPLDISEKIKQKYIKKHIKENPIII